MATYTLAPLARYGISPEPGMLIYTVTAGGDYPGDAAVTYTTDAGTPNANPIEALGTGLFPAIYLAPGHTYKFIVNDADDLLIFTQDGIAAVPGSTSGEDVIGTTGEIIAAEAVAYCSDGSGGLNAGQWYNADADNPYSSSEAGTVGVALAALAAGDQGSFRIGGQMTIANSSLNPGSKYYVSATAGALTTSVLSNSRYVGEADGVNSILIAANPLQGESLNFVQILAFC